MRTFFLASLRTHIRRYVAAAIAVTVAVAFVVGVGVLTTGAQTGIMAGFGAPFRNSDYVVSKLRNEDAFKLVERHGENASPLGRAMLTVRAGGRSYPEMGVGPVAASTDLRWQKLTSGRFPERKGEAVVDLWDAQNWDVSVDDRIRIGEGATAADFTVVGIVQAPSPVAQASVYVTWPQLVRWADDPSLGVYTVTVRGAVGPVPEDAKVQTPEQAIADRTAQLQNGVDTWSLLLLLFAGIAVFVSILVIANTFSILLAQRLRDFALLRCVGATRRQVTSSVRREAAVVGLLASLAGVLVGIGLGYGLIALIKSLSPITPIASPPLPAPWLLGGLAIGLTGTLVAAWLPIRRVVRVSPLAALRPDTATDPRTASGRARLALAAFLLIAGLLLLVLAMVWHSTVLMLAGGGSMFIGVLLFGPVLIPRLIQITGTRFGPIGQLATKNAVRNPRRTATTTASLLVGITLITAVLTGINTTSTALNEELDGQHPVDAALVSTGKPFSDDLLDKVRRTSGVDLAITVDGAVATVSGLDKPIPVIAAPDAKQVARDGGAFAQVEPGVIRLDESAFRQLRLQAGDKVKVAVGERRAVLRVSIGTGWGLEAIVAPETLAQLTDSSAPRAIWIRASSDADSARLVGDLGDLAAPAGANVYDQLEARETENAPLRILTWAIVALLGFSVAIALVGIANTLGLSVLERVREHALLRALGLTRRQLRQMLAAEAVLLSLVAALLGTVIGIGFAWVGYETFVKQALTNATMQVPWPLLGAVLLTAALAGLLASVLPARRAARVTPAAGLSFE
ncbi:ABC transporter permease [Streptosporangium carneum]|uniref:Membrane protein n=1 Tax=Streptosporangium carneum TaxID=47481 RepID=A0A9W6MC09_9ACTN|nr:FtsX-like permease family protein [Streptosporangium carneum]GLK08607.1 membrane protein [Streptosporangium carneum]